MIVRDLLRDQVRREIVERILDGTLPGRSRINESTLSADLGVSRTPLREALMNLAQESFLEHQPGRGFAVSAMSPEEARSAYPIAAALEGLAVRMSTPPPDPDRLTRINDEILANQQDALRCFELDSEFHLVLVADCQNSRLLEILAGLKLTMNRYEMAYMRRTTADRSARRTVTSSVQEHREIVDRLRAGDLDGAARAIEVNWERGMERLIEILQEPGIDR
jgi:DNA-binding GntR family transcriptional regulator